MLLFFILLFFTIIIVFKQVILRKRIKSNRRDNISDIIHKVDIINTPNGKKPLLIGFKLYLKNIKRKYYYLYLYSSKKEFLSNIKRLVIGSKINIECYYKTNIIDKIFIDGVEYPSNYKEIKIIKGDRKKYSNYLNDQIIDIDYQFVKYKLNDILTVLYKSPILNSIYVINKDDNFILISSEIEKKSKVVLVNNSLKYNEKELVEFLCKSNFVFNDFIKVIAGQDLTNPEFFIESINEIDN